MKNRNYSFIDYPEDRTVLIKIYDLVLSDPRYEQSIQIGLDTLGIIKKVRLKPRQKEVDVI